ncbi:MAG: hypothetical protein CXT73_05505 [Methanobacteriota archaeon]|nr:MAG: hypothetical protein CXT73_05505 [Euryarchaeota archaeon]
MSSIVMKNFPFKVMGEMAFQTARAASSAAKVAKKERVDLAKEAANAARNRVKTMKENVKTRKQEIRTAKITAKDDRKTLKTLRDEPEAKTFMATAKKVEKLGDKKKTVAENFLNARANVPEDLRHILDNKKTNNKKWLEENVDDELKRELVTQHNKARFACNRMS